MLQLHPATLSDIPTLSRMHLSAFMLVRINQALYPSGVTPPILAATETRHRTTFLHDPTAHYLKIVAIDGPGPFLSPSEATAAAAENTPSGHPYPRIIAFAEYHLFPTAAIEATRQDLKPKTWPPDVNLSLATEFWGHITAARKTMAGIPHVFLSVIATAPGEGRRGAGKMLMAWGTEAADRAGLPCFLEASPMGAGLYRGFGFERVVGFEVRLDEGEVYSHEVMIRPARERGRDGRGEQLREGVHSLE
jgi:hypothetical protein